MVKNHVLDVRKVNEKDDWRTQGNLKRLSFSNAITDAESIDRTIGSDRQKLNNRVYRELSSSRREGHMTETNLERQAGRIRLFWGGGGRYTQRTVQF